MHRRFDQGNPTRRAMGWSPFRRGHVLDDPMPSPNARPRRGTKQAPASSIRASQPSPSRPSAAARRRPRDDAGTAEETTRDRETAPAAAHRPSRRDLIIDAAIRVFAHKGFSETSMQDIADEAGIVAKAIYYHFAGKERLFEAALSRVMAANYAVVADARPDEAPADAETFRKVVYASWAWANANPDMARVLFLHMPSGATPEARELTREYQDRHVRRAYDYFDSGPISVKGRRGAAEYAVRTLAVRTVIGLAMTVHPLQMEGVLPAASEARMRSATADVCVNIFRNL
jgi:AcrR family transcriptional regulator